MTKRSSSTMGPQALLLQALTAMGQLQLETSGWSEVHPERARPGRRRIMPNPRAGILVGGQPTPVSLSATTPAVLPTPALTPSVKALRKQTQKIEPKLDPRLQVAVARARTGAKRSRTTSATADEIPVIARVKDLTAWVALSEVREGGVIGKTTNGDALVTARIPVKRIENVRRDQNVVSLKAAQTVYPALTETVRDLGIRPPAVADLPDANDGERVVVGIVDFGCDFAHQNFLDDLGRTRIEALWDQAAPATPQSPHGYGRVYTRGDIDAALQTADPYAALGHFPEGSDHGTHVMDIACGNGAGTGVAGCAPRATIVFVQCSTSRLPWTGAEAVGVSFGDSVQLLEAVDFIFRTAGDRPCVVNLSLGTNGGPHDGSTLVEQGLDALVRARPNRAIVIAASNSQADDIHTTVKVPVAGSAGIVWRTVDGFSGHELEIWLNGASRVAVELIAPDGTPLGIVEPDDTLSLGSNGEVAIFVSNRTDDPNNRDNFAGVFLAGGLEPGEWTVRLHSRNDVAAEGHAWIERSDRAQSSFAEPVPTHTLGSISCGHETIVVGSFDAHKLAKPISYFSSSGPTRDGRQKPEVSAPGHAVVAADALSVDGVVAMSGTSMAAPAVTGLVALLLAAAQSRGELLSIAQIRALVTGSARRNPPAGAAWDPRMGAGRAFAGAVTPAPVAISPTPFGSPNQVTSRVEPPS